MYHTGQSGGGFENAESSRSQVGVWFTVPDICMKIRTDVNHVWCLFIMPFEHRDRRLCPVQVEVKIHDLNPSTNTEEDVCPEHTVLEVSRVYPENRATKFTPLFWSIVDAETAFQVRSYEGSSADVQPASWRQGPRCGS